MKHYLLSFLLTMAVFCVFQTASANEPEDNESRHVIVTLKSGEKVEARSTGDGRSGTCD